jgi:DNA primase
MVMRITNRTYFEAVRLVNSYKIDVDIEKQIIEIVDRPKEIKPFDMGMINNLHSNLINSSRGREYFYSRNIFDNAQKELLLGYSINQDMVTVPVFDVNNICVGFVGRSVEGKVFKNSTGLPKKHILFNLNNSKRKDLVVVESSFDAIRLWQLGINSVATLGATISRNQIKLLSNYANSITICPDNDDAGKRLEDKIKDNIDNRVVNVVRLPGGKDVGDHSDEELSDIFKDIGNKFTLPV